MQQLIVYIHGFQSSPQSAKALLTRAYFTEHYPEVRLATPQIPCYPLAAVKLLEHLVSQYPDWKIGFIGSSLGGYLSTYLANKFGGKAVLINPAVKPFELLEDYSEELVQPYTGEKFTLSAEHIQQLQALEVLEFTQPKRYWAMLQTGDETLDYRQAADKYAQAKLTIEQGGDHSFVGFKNHLPAIADFLLKDDG
ncbi:YqiA/YcfP family alpha/beta fold hydrolase [Alteromonadaceae bacterium BrNp21-10]|nr:YqiA/YcfP family alpha/beta fold hydrolase [Alteromonadaceae bacterium BrNp21-10]